MSPLFIVSLITAFSVAAVYMPSVIVNQWLNYQDPFFITQNPMVVAGQHAWLNSLSKTIWMPLVFWVYRLEFLSFGLNPVAFHLFNLIAHVLSVVMVGLVMARFTSQHVVVCLAAICYGLLPIHASYVAVASGLVEILSNLFIASLVFCVLKFLKKKKKRWLLATLGVLVLLLMTKPLLRLPINVLLLMVAGLCFWVALLAKRFNDFLNTQEKIIKYVFWFGLSVLILLLAGLSVERSLWYKNDLTLWQQIVKHQPSVASYVELARALQQNLPKHPSAKEVEAIRTCYSKARGINSKNPAIYLEEADFNFRLNLPKEAKKNLNDLLTVVPKQPDAIMGLAQGALIEHDYERMINLINQLLSLYPDNEELMLKAIALYGKAVFIFPNEKILKEKREELLADIEELAKRKQYTAVDFYNLAMLYQQVGGKEEAMRYYQQALALNPNHKLALYNLALLKQSTNDFKTALMLYERLIKLDNKFTLAYLNIGRIYGLSNDWLKAKQLFLKTIDIDPNNADAYFNLGYIAENERDLKQAMEYYEKAVEFNPANAEAYYNLGNVYANQGLTAEAIASYLKTVDVQPNHMNAYVNLSILSFKVHDVKGSVRYLEKARALGYTPPDAYLKTLAPYMK